MGDDTFHYASISIHFTIIGSRWIIYIHIWSGRSRPHSLNKKTFATFTKTIKTQTMINYHNQPAFPPQVAQDNLGRLMAPIPGMTKLEFYAVILLPTYISLAQKKDGLTIRGRLVSPYDAAIEAAKILIEKLNNQEDEKPTLQIAE